MTTAELDELEELLKKRELHLRRESLKNTEGKNPNYQLLIKASSEQEYNSDDKLISGFSGVGLEGSSRCFEGNQTVITIDGFKKISEITKNDLVKTYNEKTKNIEFNKVLDNFKMHNNKKCILVKMKDGTEIRCTEDHKFFYNGKWVEIKKIIENLW